MIANLISRVSPFLNKLVPNALAMKGISKLDPRLKKFLDNATLLYGADVALNFLREEFGDNPPDRSMRPDERAAISRRERADMPLKALGTAAKVGGALALGGLGGGAAAGADVLQGEILPPEQMGQRPPLGVGYQNQRALPGRGQAGYEAQAPIPTGQINMGYEPTAESEKREALKKYLKHRSDLAKKQNPPQRPLIEDLQDRLEKQQPKNKEEELYETFLASLNKILNM